MIYKFMLKHFYSPFITVVVLHIIVFFRYSMSSCVRGNCLWLVGGVGLLQSPDIIVANLITRVWYGIKLKVCAWCYI